MVSYIFKDFRRLFVIILGLALAMPVAAQISMSELINQAGRQRMLSQRIVKAYAQIAQDIQTETSREQLAGASKLFETQLRTLQQHAPNDTIRGSLGKVEQLWLPFRDIANGPVTKDGAQKLVDTNNELLQAAHRVVLQLEDAAGNSFARLVNIAGRQRMLSQRIAKSYMLLSWGFNSAELREELERARYEFEGAQAELRNAKENSPKIQAGLAEVDRQWTIFRKSFGLKESGEYIPLLVAMASESILIQMNDITNQYAQLDESKGSATTDKMEQELLRLRAR